MRLLSLALLAAALLALPGGSARGEDVAGEDAATAKIRHLLRRATFGPRPADVEAVAAMGIEAWIDRQLEPATIPDPEVDRRLEGFETLRMTSSEYVARLRGRAMAAGSEGPPGKGEDRVELARRRQQEINRLRNQAAREVPRAILTRAVYSERQLEQVMSEFWRNHFNVDITKDDVRYYIPDWERTVIRAHVFGRFEDFLAATAKHPAMLFYLDNHVSQAPLARAEKVRAGREDETRTGGLNENYARELMELHTVGADNGYSQEDVIQLALVLTGWSIQDGEFLYRDDYHARGAKRVIGKTVKGGIDEGEGILEYLADHKLTRRFIVTKMARFLQSDEPDPGLVEDVEKVWAKTKGDLKAVTKAILVHDAFYAEKSVLTKARTPFEFVAAALRVTGAAVTDMGAVIERLADMGQPTLRQEDPTGYSDRSVDWMDTGVLAVRWQFAYDMAEGRLPGVSVQDSPLYDHLRQQPEVWEYLLVESLLAGQRPGSLTMAPFQRRVNDVRRDFRKMRIAELRKEFNILVTLLLGSPEFQRQ